MMNINNLTVKKNDKTILNNLSTTFEEGKIHIIMGPNGSGKSTLSYTLAGHPDCLIQSGQIYYREKELTEIPIEERALEGIYLAPQYPPVIEGLSHAAFLKESINVRRKFNNLEPLDDFEFLKELRSIAKEFSFDEKQYPRQSLNQGFSGGEKKRNEILQIHLLKPNFVILDEIDSGLDIEAMKKIANYINNYKKENKTLVIITHYPNFAQLLDVDFVHIIKDGKVVLKDTKEVIEQVVEHGFGGINESK